MKDEVQNDSTKTSYKSGKLFGKQMSETDEQLNTTCIRSITQCKTFIRSHFLLKCSKLAENVRIPQ